MLTPKRTILSWCGALAVALALAPPAVAQDDPQIDPDSPPGTEYQLPIDRAREQASSGTSSGKGGEAPLFGEGVGNGKSGAKSNSKSGSGGQSGSDRGEGTAQRNDQLGASTSKVVQTGASAADGGGMGITAIGAGAAGVLLIGGLAGLFLRRRWMRGP